MDLGREICFRLCEQTEDERLFLCYEDRNCINLLLNKLKSLDILLSG